MMEAARSRSAFIGSELLREPAQDCPLYGAHVRAVDQRERLAQSDLGLGDDTWPGTAVWPSRAVNEERVTQIHVAGFAGRRRARPLESAFRETLRRRAEERSRVAIRRQHARNIEMRAHE